MGLFSRKPKEPGATVIVVAAGSASRMEGIDKLMAELDGFPVVVHALRAFEMAPSVERIVVVVREEDIPLYMDMVLDFGLGKVGPIVRGGDSRQQSVFAGLRQVADDTPLVCIHDGARPLVTPELIERCIADARTHGATTAAVKVKDTIKVANEDGTILHTPDREKLYQIQTPQVFSTALYKEAMERALAMGAEYTDDCQLIEAMGHKVFLSKGDYQNLKITTPEDLPVAEALLVVREEGYY